MKDTTQNRKGLSTMRSAATRLNTGYQITLCQDECGIALEILTPRDTDEVSYPDVYYYDNHYGTHAIYFQIITSGYGDHSLAQAQRTLRGLEKAIALVNKLYEVAEFCGLSVYHE